MREKERERERGSSCNNLDHVLAAQPPNQLVHLLFVSDRLLLTSDKREVKISLWFVGSIELCICVCVCVCVNNCVYLL